MDKCIKLDYREFIWGIMSGKPKSLKGEIGRVSKITPLSEKIVKEVVAWAGKLTTK